MKDRQVLILGMENHRGQIKLSEADVYIKELEESTGEIWGKDFTPYLSDNDPEFWNVESKLNDGCCWIVRKYSKKN